MANGSRESNGTERGRKWPKRSETYRLSSTSESGGGRVKESARLLHFYVDGPGRNSRSTREFLVTSRHCRYCYCCCGCCCSAGCVLGVFLRQWDRYPGRPNSKQPVGQDSAGSGAFRRGVVCTPRREGTFTTKPPPPCIYIPPPSLPFFSSSFHLSLSFCRYSRGHYVTGSRDGGGREDGRESRATAGEQPCRLENEGEGCYHPTCAANSREGRVVFSPKWYFLPSSFCISSFSPFFGFISLTR